MDPNGSCLGEAMVLAPDASPSSDGSNLLLQSEAEWVAGLAAYWAWHVAPVGEKAEAPPVDLSRQMYVEYLSSIKQTNLTIEAQIRTLFFCIYFIRVGVLLCSDFTFFRDQPDWALLRRLTGVVHVDYTALCAPSELLTARFGSDSPITQNDLLGRKLLSFLLLHITAYPGFSTSFYGRILTTEASTENLLVGYFLKIFVHAVYRSPFYETFLSDFGGFTTLLYEGGTYIDTWSTCYLAQSPNSLLIYYTIKELFDLGTFPLLVFMRMGLGIAGALVERATLLRLKDRMCDIDGQERTAYEVIDRLGEPGTQYLDLLKSVGALPEEGARSKWEIALSATHPDFSVFPDCSEEGFLNPLVANERAFYGRLVRGPYFLQYDHVTDYFKRIREVGCLKTVKQVVSDGRVASGTPHHSPRDVVYATHALAGLHHTRDEAKTICRISPTESQIASGFITPHLSSFSSAARPIPFALKFNGINGNYTEVMRTLICDANRKPSYYVKSYYHYCYPSSDSPGTFVHEYRVVDENFSAFIGKDLRSASVKRLISSLRELQSEQDSTDTAFYAVLLRDFAGNPGDPAVEAKIRSAIALLLDGKMAECHIAESIPLAQITVLPNDKMTSFPVVVFDKIYAGEKIPHRFFSEDRYTKSAWLEVLRAIFEAKNLIALEQFLLQKSFGFSGAVSFLINCSLSETTDFCERLAQLMGGVFEKAMPCQKLPRILFFDLLPFLSEKLLSIFCFHLTLMDAAGESFRRAKGLALETLFIAFYPGFSKLQTLPSFQWVKEDVSKQGVHKTLLALASKMFLDDNASEALEEAYLKSLNQSASLDSKYADITLHFAMMAVANGRDVVLREFVGTPLFWSVAARSGELTFMRFLRQVFKRVLACQDLSLLDGFKLIYSLMAESEKFKSFLTVLADLPGAVDRELLLSGCDASLLILAPECERLPEGSVFRRVVLMCAEHVPKQNLQAILQLANRLSFLSALRVIAFLLGMGDENRQALGVSLGKFVLNSLNKFREYVPYDNSYSGIKPQSFVVRESAGFVASSGVLVAFLNLPFLPFEKNVSVDCRLSEGLGAVLLRSPDAMINDTLAAEIIAAPLCWGAYRRKVFYLGLFVQLARSGQFAALDQLFSKVTYPALDAVLFCLLTCGVYDVELAAACPLLVLGTYGFSQGLAIGKEKTFQFLLRMVARGVSFSDLKKLSLRVKENKVKITLSGFRLMLALSGYAFVLEGQPDKNQLSRNKEALLASTGWTPDATSFADAGRQACYRNLMLCDALAEPLMFSNDSRQLAAASLVSGGYFALLWLMIAYSEYCYRITRVGKLSAAKSLSDLIDWGASGLSADLLDKESIFGENTASVIFYVLFSRFFLTRHAERFSGSGYQIFRKMLSDLSSAFGLSLKALLSKVSRAKRIYVPILCEDGGVDLFWRLEFAKDKSACNSGGRNFFDRAGVYCVDNKNNNDFSAFMRALEDDAPLVEGVLKCFTQETKSLLNEPLSSGKIAARCLAVFTFSGDVSCCPIIQEFDWIRLCDLFWDCQDPNVATEKKRFFRLAKVKQDLQRILESSALEAVGEQEAGACAEQALLPCIEKPIEKVKQYMQYVEQLESAGKRKATARKRKTRVPSDKASAAVLAQSASPALLAPQASTAEDNPKSGPKKPRKAGELSKPR